MCYDIKVIANILRTLISVRANFDDSYRANECRLHGNTEETQIPINSLGSRTAKFVSRKLKAAFIVSEVVRATRERKRDRKTVSVLVVNFSRGIYYRLDFRTKREYTVFVLSYFNIAREKSVILVYLSIFMYNYIAFIFIYLSLIFLFIYLPLCRLADNVSSIKLFFIIALFIAILYSTFFVPFNLLIVSCEYSPLLE